MFRSGAYPLTHESGCHEYRERVKNRALAREISSSASETDEGKQRVPGTRGAPRTATSPSSADRAARLRSRSAAINGARAHPSGSLAGRKDCMYSLKWPIDSTHRWMRKGAQVRRHRTPHVRSKNPVCEIVHTSVLIGRRRRARVIDISPNTLSGGPAAER